MDTAQLAICAVSISMLAFAALMLFGPAYLYYRGRSGASPLPPVIDRIVNPQPKPPKPEPPKPPSHPCPYCTANPPTYTLTAANRWECKACKETIPGPTPKTGA